MKSEWFGRLASVKWENIYMPEFEVGQIYKRMYVVQDQNYLWSLFNSYRSVTTLVEVVKVDMWDLYYKELGTTALVKIRKSEFKGAYTRELEKEAAMTFDRELEELLNDGN